MSQINRREVLASASVLALIRTGTQASHSKAATAQTPPGKACEVGRAGRERFNDGWRFAFGNLNDCEKDFGWGKDLGTFAKQGPNATPVAASDYDDSQWRPLNLPHDWAVELPFVHKADEQNKWWDPAASHGFKPLGRDYPDTSIGWYRKTLKLDAADKGKRISLEFDGIFRNAIVLINGYIVRQHDGGYTPFRVGLNDFLNTDDTPNTIVVRVDASLGEGWFYEGAGMYRHVWLVKTNPVYIPQYGVCVRAKTDGTVEVTTTVRNDSDHDIDATLQLSTEDDPELGESTLSVNAHGEAEFVQSFNINTPRKWSLENPYLYRLTTTLWHDAPQGDGVLDKVTTPFGFRDIRFEPDTGFFLNGKSVKLKGTCNHQDHAGIGTAIPDAIQRYRLQCLKDMGCNAYRTSHNPPTPELLDLCDEMGILVIDETRMMTSSEQGLDDLTTMIKRDRNHPSVILWSIGNEEPQEGTDRGAVIARHMKRVCNDLDPTRGITAAMDNGYGHGLTSVLDVIGFNYRDAIIDDFHKTFPKLPIIGTETASAVGTRGEYVKNDAAHIVRAYDTEAPSYATTAEGWWPHFDSKPFIGGGFIWTGFDYRGEPTPFSTWPSISSQFGVLDTCGFPKDTYYYYRAWWRPEAMLHLFPHWNWEAGSTVSVWAYSNCDAVELFINGKSAGKKTTEKDRHVEWSVAYQPGKIVAYGYKNGRVVLKETRETAGTPAKIVLTADRSALLGDGRDCAVIRAEIFDKRGIPVPRADNLIRFAVTGPAAVIGVGNGNPNSHEPDKASQRMAFNGLCCAIVQTTGAGAITFTAHADGLLAGQVSLTAS